MISPDLFSNAFACLNQEAEEKMEGDKTWHCNWNWVFFTKREKLDLREADVQIITFNNLPSFTSQSISKKLDNIEIIAFTFLL